MAGIVDIPKFVDFRNKVKRHPSLKFPVLSLKGKTTLAVHHSLTKQGLGGSNAESYARYHVDTLGWPSIGYSYVIEPDGTVKFCNDIELRTYHVGNHNNYAVGICLTGDFRYEKPTKEQERSLRNLVFALQKKYSHLKYVKGHSEFSGYEWKACPVFDFRKVLKNGTSTYTPPKKQTKPITVEKESNKGVEWVGTNDKGKRVESIYKGSEGLNFYDSPRWNNPTGTFGYGTGWKVDNMYRVDGSLMYRVQNSNGDPFYITASSKYVKVEGESKPKAATSKPKATGSAIVPYPGHLIKVGSRGKDVERIQRAVGVKADGDFGSKTEKAVKAYQRRHGLSADGLVGIRTWNTMF